MKTEFDCGDHLSLQNQIFTLMEKLLSGETEEIRDKRDRKSLVMFFAELINPVFETYIAAGVGS